MTGKFDIAAAEKALEVLVLAYREERTKPQPDEPIELKNASEVKLAGRKQAYREDIIERPMIGALRLAIREVGEYLWQNTKSTGAMLKVLENVAARHPDKQSQILAAVDHAWDGLGEGDDMWWC